MVAVTVGVKDAVPTARVLVAVSVTGVSVGVSVGELSGAIVAVSLGTLDGVSVKVNEAAATVSVGVFVGNSMIGGVFVGTGVSVGSGATVAGIGVSVSGAGVLVGAKVGCGVFVSSSMMIGVLVGGTNGVMVGNAVGSSGVAEGGRRVGGRTCPGVLMIGLKEVAVPPRPNGVIEGRPTKVLDTTSDGDWAGGVGVDAVFRCGPVIASKTKPMQ